jgi:hypothetical protein
MFFAVRRALRGEKGFTLLEMMIIIGILGMLSAMVVPLFNQMNRAQRVRATREKLDVVRTAIVGPANIYDGHGLRVVGGYAGDENALPKLYASDWDNERKAWVWQEVYKEDPTGYGQPRGLWLKGPEPGTAELADDAPDYSAWSGPYLSYPYDPYPGNTRNLEWSKDGDNSLFEQRQAEGKLSDAWGQVFYFLKEPDGDGTALLIVSAGPDGKIALPEPPHLYDETVPVNKDNIAVKIRHHDWYTVKRVQRIVATREKLDTIRMAVIGMAAAYNERGLRVVGGYAGDIDTLPKLYASYWNDELNAWVWQEEENEDLTGRGQPRGLWRGPEPGVAGLAGDAPDYTDWRGPYLSYPYDPYPDNTRNLQWIEGGDNSLFEQRQAEGKLSDAWGQILYFFKEPDGEGTALLIVSAGPDGEIAVPEPGQFYDEALPENNDNIVFTIRHHEWYTVNQSFEVEQTKRLLEMVRSALLGPQDAFDVAGRRIVGGYLGDLGRWPTLWQWDEEENKWAVSPEPEEADQPTTGQPRGLWVWHTDEGESNFETGFAWRGPYLAEPWGEGPGEVLRDVWGTPLRFELDGKSLAVTSAGRDRDFDKTADNLMMSVDAGQWHAGAMTVSGTIVNKNLADGLHAKVKIYNAGGEAATVTDYVYLEPGRYSTFSLVCTEIHAGMRLLEAWKKDGAGAVMTDRVYLFIGAGKTQSPTAERLVLTVE